MNLSELINLVSDGYIAVYDMKNQKYIKNLDGINEWLNINDIYELGIENKEIISLDISFYNYICANVYLE